ncbi:MAG: hypothetical protein BroJett003_28000 [Planctomycetota bacterium]|nr:MAG: hypothetical protein BroJett003_28000 [Planctomycetota bacterium]
MTLWFADTAFYIALLSESDRFHDRAVELNAVPHRSVTTQFVLTELADGLSGTAARASCVRLLDALLRSKAVLVVPAAASLFDRGWELYRNRPDKEWSLTDCISFLVMEERNLREALTADHHFEQAGFVALMK